MIRSQDFEAMLWKELPDFYLLIKDIKELVRVEAKQLALLDNWTDELVEQQFVETATWGLARWEKIFGIETDTSKPLDQRRSVIKSKIRGAGVVTKTMVKSVAESWYNGETEVTEGPLIVTVKFLSNYGVPSNLKDVEKALRDIIPAHLGIEFDFKFLLIRDVNNMTLNELESTPLNKFAGGA